MKINLKRVIFMIMYYFPRPTTELIERLVWVYERDRDSITLIFDWDEETGKIPISPDIRQALDEMVVGKVVKKVKTASNTTGDKNRRNYVWATVDDPMKSYYYQYDLFDKDTIVVFRHLQSNPSRLLGLIRDHKNSAMTKTEMFEMLTEEFRVKSFIKPKRAKSKSAKSLLRE